MSWSRFAAETFADARRDRTLHSVAVLLAVVGAGLGRGYAGAVGADGSPPLSAFTPVLLGVLTPILALPLAYDVLPAERRSGRARALLSSPHTRADLVVGAALGRLGVAGVGVAALVGAQAAVAAALGAPVALLDVAGYLLATLCYAAALVAPVVALSTLTSSGPFSLALGALAMTAAVTWRGLLQMAWQVTVGSAAPSWFRSVAALGPLDVYIDAAPLATPRGDAGGVGVLLGWAAVSLALGVVAFRRADL